MKKLIVIALAVVLALTAFVALAACAKEETYDGEYSYYALNSTEKKYGVKVHVTVKGGVIMKVTADADTETFYNATAPSQYSSWAGYEAWTTGGQAAYLEKFVGLTVEEVKAIVVPVYEQDDTTVYAPKGQPNHNIGISELPDALALPSHDDIPTGATQSVGRIILAVQNALKDVK